MDVYLTIQIKEAHVFFYFFLDTITFVARQHFHDKYSSGSKNIQAFSSHSGMNSSQLSSAHGPLDRFFHWKITVQSFNIFHGNYTLRLSPDWARQYTRRQQVLMWLNIFNIHQLPRVGLTSNLI